jgi:phage gpG-like protein
MSEPIVRGFFPMPSGYYGGRGTSGTTPARANTVPAGYHKVTLDEMADRLNRGAQNMPNVTRAALDRAAMIIQQEAKRVIGTYEYGWPRLKPSTIARKVPGDTPLLETGEMRDSIEYSVSEDGKEAFVGSNNPKAVWQELGTSRGIPPRSFLMGAAMHKEAEVNALVGNTVHLSLTMSDAELVDITGMVDKAFSGIR